MLKELELLFLGTRKGENTSQVLLIHWIRAAICFCYDLKEPQCLANSLLSLLKSGSSSAEENLASLDIICHTATWSAARTWFSFRGLSSQGSIYGVCYRIKLILISSSVLAGGKQCSALPSGPWKEKMEVNQSELAIIFSSEDNS